MSTFGLNTSSQVCWPLVNCTINQRLLHAALHMQLRDVRGLPLPVRRSSKPVSCTFLDNFLFLFVSSYYQKIPESVAEHCSLLIPISFKSKLFLLQYQFEIFTRYLLTFTWQWRHVYAMNKKVNSLFTDSIYSCFHICKSYWNPSRFSRVMITNVLPPFLWFTVYVLNPSNCIYKYEWFYLCITKMSLPATASTEFCSMTQTYHTCRGVCWAHAQSSGSVMCLALASVQTRPPHSSIGTQASRYINK